jgi:hypothetical protein
MLQDVRSKVALLSSRPQQENFHQGFPAGCTPPPPPDAISTGGVFTVSQVDEAESDTPIWCQG